MPVDRSLIHQVNRSAEPLSTSEIVFISSGEWARHLVSGSQSEPWRVGQWKSNRLRLISFDELENFCNRTPFEYFDGLPKAALTDRMKSVFLEMEEGLPELCEQARIHSLTYDAFGTC